MTASGRYRLGPDSTPDRRYQSWIDLTDGQGFAVHTLSTIGLDKLVRMLIRGVMLGSGIDGRSDFLFHVGLDGSLRGRLTIQRPVAPAGLNDSITIPLLGEFQLAPQGEPSRISFHGSEGQVAVEGEAKVDRVLDRFMIGEHMTLFERIIAGAFTQVHETRELMKTSVRLRDAEGHSILEGVILADVIDFADRESAKSRR